MHRGGGGLTSIDPNIQYHYAFQSGILLFCFAIMIQFHVKFLVQFGIFKFNSVMLHFDTVFCRLRFHIRHIRLVSIRQFNFIFG